MLRTGQQVCSHDHQEIPVWWIGQTDPCCSSLRIRNLCVIKCVLQSVFLSNSEWHLQAASSLRVSACTFPSDPWASLAFCDVVNSKCRAILRLSSDDQESSFPQPYLDFQLATFLYALQVGKLSGCGRLALSLVIVILASDGVTLSCSTPFSVSCMRPLHSQVNLRWD